MDETAIWNEIVEKLALLDECRKKNELPVTKINRVHRKLLEKDSVTTSQAIADKLGDLYRSAHEKAEKEARILNDLLEKLGTLIASKDASEKDSDLKKKKRKAEEKKAVDAKVKKPKISEESVTDSFKVGDLVIVKPEGEDWIMAYVTRYLSDKNRYEVEDAEEDETSPGAGIKKRYVFPAKAIIRVPDQAPKSEYQPGQVVLALFPQSSCFYKAVIVQPPSMNVLNGLQGVYSIAFEDDNNLIRYVPENRVIEYPKHIDKKK